MENELAGEIPRSERKEDTLNHRTQKNAPLSEISQTILPPDTEPSLSFIRDEITKIQKELAQSDSHFLKKRKLPIERVPSFALPIVGSIVANRHDSSISILSPKAEEIFDMKRWIGWVYSFLHFFSATLATWFKSSVEEKATKKVDVIGNKIANSLDMLAGIHDPKKEFITELTKLYQGITESKSPQRSMYSAFVRLNDLKRNSDWVPNDPLVSSITPENYPLLVDAMQYRKKPLSPYMSVAMPEIMKGIETFLRSNNVTDINPAPSSGKGFGRFLVKNLVPRKLDFVSHEVPAAFQTVFNVLPQNGSDFTKSVYSFANNMMSLKNEGISNKTIGDKVISSHHL